MKTFTPYPKGKAAGLALVLAITAAPEAEAITRHCRGAYFLQVVAPGSPVNGWYRMLPVPNFSAAGSCGSTQPNKCRERARDRVNRCMEKHWDDRWLFTRPVLCTAAAGVSGYNFDDLKRGIEISVCCPLRSPIRNLNLNIPIRVYRHSYGDRGCGTGEVLLNMQSHTVRLSSRPITSSTAPPSGSGTVPGLSPVRR
jgi:hypothetical protein